jgi:hypothetical protein
MSDHSKANKKAPYELLSMETALLISTAPSRNIDVSLWFNEKSNNGRLVQKDFDSKLYSLASTMGINQDQETKAELELAVSPLAIRMVHSLCQAGEDDKHQPLINVGYFFQLCEEKVNKYLMEVEAAELAQLQEEHEQQLSQEGKQGNESDFRTWEEGEYDIATGRKIGGQPRVERFEFDAVTGRKIGGQPRVEREAAGDEEQEESEAESTDEEQEQDEDEEESVSEDRKHSNEMAPEEKIQLLYENTFQKGNPADQQASRYHNSEPAEDDDDFVHFSAEEYIKDIQEKSQGDRPLTAPSGMRGSQRGESTDQVLQFSKDDSHRHQPVAGVRNKKKTSAVPVAASASLPVAQQKTKAVHKNSHVAPSSPYDEEFPLGFEEEGEEEDNDVDTAEYIRSHTQHQSFSPPKQPKMREGVAAGVQEEKKQPPPTTQQSSNTKKKIQRPFNVEITNVGVPSSNKKQLSSTDWHEENRKFLMASGPDAKEKTAARPTSASFGKQQQQSKDSIKKSTDGAARPRPTSAEPTRIKARNSTLTPNSRLSSRANQPSALETSIEDDLRGKSIEQLISEGVFKDKNDLVKSLLQPPKRSASVEKTRGSFNGFNRYLNRQNRSLTPNRAGLPSSTPHFKPSELTDEEINHIKDVVEDQVRNIVKKTDLYHLLQVSLGYIEDYTMIPPRGEIIVSRTKEWISDRDIHMAFLTSRLFLNDQSIYALKKLVYEFAINYRALYLEKLNHLITFKNNPELEKENLPKHVKNSVGQLNNEWFKKYLLHLRLTKRLNSSQSNRTLLSNSQKEMNELIQQTMKEPLPMEESMEANRESSSNEPQMPSSSEKDTKDSKNPVPWKQWLAKKLQEEITSGPKQPKEISKILNGFWNTTLSKEEIELYMKTHPNFLPEEVLMQEIEYRIESWILDMDGRRDFQHQLNMKIRAFIWEELILKQQPPASQNTSVIPKDEKVYWKLYYRLSTEEKLDIKQKIITQLILEKRENLKTSERMSKEITKSLFWSFYIVIKDRNTASIAPNSYLTWQKWLPDHLEKFASALEKYKNDKMVLKKQISRHISKKKSLASLLSIEKELKYLSSHLDHFHQIELQKGIIKLRRLAKEKGIGDGEIVTKEDFDNIIKPILTPYISLNDTMIMDEEDAKEQEEQNAMEGIVVKAWKEKISPLFKFGVEETLQQVIKDHEDEKEYNKKSYEKWMSEKRRVEREKLEEKVSCLRFDILAFASFY